MYQLPPELIDHILTYVHPRDKINLNRQHRADNYVAAITQCLRVRRQPSAYMRFILEHDAVYLLRSYLPIAAHNVASAKGCIIKHRYWRGHVSSVTPAYAVTRFVNDAEYTAWTFNSKRCIGYLRRFQDAHNATIV